MQRNDFTRQCLKSWTSNTLLPRRWFAQQAKTDFWTLGGGTRALFQDAARIGPVPLPDFCRMSGRVLGHQVQKIQTAQAGKMDYDKTFEIRGKQYKYAVETYPHVLETELQTAVAMCALKPGETMLNIPAACVSLGSYVPDSVTYVERESNAAFAALTGTPYGRLDNTGLADGSVDVIVSVASLHHATDEERRVFYHECHRILRKGGNGRLVIGDVRRGSPQDTWLNEFVNAMNSSGHVGRFWDMEPCGRDFQLLEACGFQVSANIQHYDWTFSSVAAMLDFVRNLFGLDLAKDDAALLTAIQSHLGFNVDAKDGSVRFPWELAYFVATT